MDRLTLFPASSPQARRGAECRVYSRIVSGVGELFYGDTEGREVQLTRAGQPTSAAAKLAEGNAATLAGKGAESYVETSQVGAASGVAGLDASGHVPVAQGGTGAGDAAGARSALGIADPTSRTLWTRTSDGAVYSTTAETSAGGSGVGSKTVPANSVAAGTTFRVVVCGSAVASGASSMVELAVKLGGVTLSSVATAPGTTAKGFRLEVLATIRAAGASGSVVAATSYAMGTSARAYAPDAPQTIDTTADQTFDVTVTPKVNSASDGATVVLSLIERLR